MNWLDFNIGDLHAEATQESYLALLNLKKSVFKVHSLSIPLVVYRDATFPTFVGIPTFLARITTVNYRYVCFLQRIDQNLRFPTFGEIGSGISAF